MTGPMSALDEARAIVHAQQNTPYRGFGDFRKLVKNGVIQSGTEIEVQRFMRGPVFYTYDGRNLRTDGSVLSPRKAIGNRTFNVY